MIMRCSTGRRCAPFQVDAQCSHLQRTGMFWGLIGSTWQCADASGSPTGRGAPYRVMLRTI